MAGGVSWVGLRGMLAWVARQVEGDSVGEKAVQACGPGVAMGLWSIAPLQLPAVRREQGQAQQVAGFQFDVPFDAAPTGGIVPPMA